MSPLRWKTSEILEIQYEFLTISEPCLKGAVLPCWHCLRPITFSFSTCAKVIMQDNEVLASNDSHQHCSISYVKLTDPGYWLYWKAGVSFWKLKISCLLKSEEIGRDAQLTPMIIWIKNTYRETLHHIHEPSASGIGVVTTSSCMTVRSQVHAGWSWGL